MGYYDGYLILSDIDGTLTRAGNDLSEENHRALTRFMKEGGYFTLATGRAPGFLSKFPIMPNAPLVSINGTLIYSDEGERLLYLPMEDNYEEVLRYFVDKYPNLLSVFRSEEKRAPKWTRAEHGEDISILLEGDPCLRFYFTCDSEPTALAMMAEALEKWGDRYEFNRSWPDGMEMHVKGSGKDAGLRFLRDYLPGIHTTIAVGNYENDTPMIREADIGCAVENALPSVEDAADRVIVSNMDHALAYIIETLIPSLKEKA